MSTPEARRELARLLALEYDRPVDLVVRHGGVLIGTLLSFAYFGDTIVFLWPVFYAATHAGYLRFLRDRLDTATSRDVTIASLLLSLVLIAFVWFPTRLLMQDDPAFALTGGTLIGCTLVFLVRRCDIHRVQIAAQAAVIGVVVFLTLGTEINRQEELLPKIALALSGAALMHFFAQASRMARDAQEKARQASDRALQMEKMSAIGVLAGGVAHDFNNNLTAIIGNLELHPLVGSEAERQAALNDAMTAADQASKTVRQLLLFARKEPLVIETLHARDVIAQVQALTDRLLPSSIHVRATISSEVPAFLGAGNQVVSALINLLTNAVDAMPDGGEITLAVTAAYCERPGLNSGGAPVPPGAYIRFAVTDCGAGIPRAILDRVAEPFFSTKPKGKGTGLGLPMVFGVAEALGGSVSITSSSDGTRVSMTLPAATEEGR